MSLRKFFDAPRIRDGVALTLRNMVNVVANTPKKDETRVTVEDVQREYGVSYDRAVRIATRINAC